MQFAGSRERKRVIRILRGKKKEEGRKKERASFFSGLISEIIMKVGG